MRAMITQPRDRDDRDAVSAVQVRPAAPPEVSSWLGLLGRGEVPILTVAAPEDYRQTVYGWCSAIEVPKWRSHGIRTEVVWNMLHFGEPLFVDLLKANSLLVEEPLRSMVDQRFYLISDLFRIILEARFRVNEGADPLPFVVALSKWIQDQKLNSKQEKLFEAAKVSRRVQPTEQLDLIFCLAALASQSGVIERLTISLDRIDLAASAGVKDRRTYLRELDDVVFGATRWEKLGSPLGVILGVERLPFLDHSTKLGKLVNSGSVHQATAV